jgi:hypothetical protein
LLDEFTYSAWSRTLHRLSRIQIPSHDQRLPAKYMDVARRMISDPPDEHISAATNPRHRK